MSCFEALYNSLQCLPEGWYNKFSKDLVNDLLQACNSNDEAKSLRILEAKEKYGEMRIYINLCDDKFDTIINKYTKLSRHTCIRCGNDVTSCELGMPICENCLNFI